MNLNKFGYTKVELIVIIVLLGFVAFITINKTSYAFEMDDKKIEAEVINLIETQAVDYAKDHLELFEESNNTVILVDDLVQNKYMIGNEEGLIIDPLDNTKNYNENKIKLEYNPNKNQVKATFVQ